jgi:hypothetical protein
MAKEFLSSEKPKSLWSMELFCYLFRGVSTNFDADVAGLALMSLSKVFYDSGKSSDCFLNLLMLSSVFSALFFGLKLELPKLKTPAELNSFLFSYIVYFSAVLTSLFLA